VRKPLLVGGLLAGLALPVHAADRVYELLQAVTPAGITAHMRALQRIADRNGGTRVAGTRGYDQSAAYVAAKLRAAGYRVQTQDFDFAYFEETAPSTLRRVSPDPLVYAEIDFATMDYSGSGDVTGVVVPTRDVIVPMPKDAPASTSNSGCEPADFEPAPDGPAIALIQRGTCTFFQKAANALAAGYDGVIVFNEGQAPLGRDGLLFGTLGGPVGPISVLGTTYALGADLVSRARRGAVVVQMTTSTVSEIRPTRNVLADSAAGRPGRVILVGAHLDSVSDGPGINDNGSGVATILEIALQVSRLGIEPRNRLRFAFWGAEEQGLIGSQYYVDSLLPAALNAIDSNLNFDMLGSPNYVRFVYDGDGSDTPDAGPPGSDAIEQLFAEHFQRRRLATRPTAFDGRSDYGPFIDVGIPAGGLFSGAEGIKSRDERRVFGGRAGVAYDACYHLVCDTIDNYSRRALDELSDGAAYAVYRLAMRGRPLVGPEARLAAAERATAAAATRLYRGPRLQR
jgi:Zn-dependent M28 family amino/carboxypeptidase